MPGIGKSVKIEHGYEKQIRAILESVFPRVGTTRFIALTSPEKQAQLVELMNICHGIRLLNLKIKQAEQEEEANGNAVGSSGVDIGLSNSLY